MAASEYELFGVTSHHSSESYDKSSPPHYDSHPAGVKCIDVTEHMNFNLGNAVKYLWRCGNKPGESEVDDLKKARWYIDREISRVQLCRKNL